MLVPSVSYYSSLGQECSKFQISVELFIAGSGYQAVPHLSVLPHFTGGQVHFYPAFNAQKDALAFGSRLQVSLFLDDIERELKSFFFIPPPPPPPPFT